MLSGDEQKIITAKWAGSADEVDFFQENFYMKGEYNRRAYT